MSTPALSTQGLNKRFGSLVVASDINIAIPQGVRYALIGPNGAGKTTLINLITGMLRPDAGKSFRAIPTSPPSRPMSASSVAWCARFRSTPCFRTSMRSSP